MIESVDVAVDRFQKPHVLARRSMKDRNCSQLAEIRIGSITTICLVFDLPLSGSLKYVPGRLKPSGRVTPRD